MSRPDNGWILTYTGRRFWPLAPRVEDIDLRDIAHALSMMCRFTGHCRYFYSVAQHSLLCARHAPYWLKASMLLHDASEAYLCDLSSPVKHAAGMEAYRTAEQRIQTLVGQRFGVSFDDPLIHQIDKRMFVTERRDLTGRISQSTGFAPYPKLIIPMGPAEAEAAFLEAAAMWVPGLQIGSSTSSSASGSMTALDSSPLIRPSSD